MFYAIFCNLVGSRKAYVMEKKIAGTVARTMNLQCEHSEVYIDGEKWNNY